MGLDYFSKEDIKQHLYFIQGEDFSSQVYADQYVEHIGFFLFHIISTNILVPVSNTMALTLLERGLPGDPSIWSTLLHDMKDFSEILYNFFEEDIFFLQGPFPSYEDDNPIYHLRFNF